MLARQALLTAWATPPEFFFFFGDRVFKIGSHELFA
jgi:hypothetical protein